MLSKRVLEESMVFVLTRLTCVYYYMYYITRIECYSPLAYEYGPTRGGVADGL